MFESWALLLILGAPLLGALGVAAFRNGTGGAARAITMTAMLIVLVAALRIFFTYDATTDAGRFALDVAWMPSLGIRFHVAVDGFAIYLLLVVAVLFPVALAASWTTAASRRRTLESRDRSPRVSLLTDDILLSGNQPRTLVVPTSRSMSPLTTRSPSFFIQEINLPVSCAISRAGMTTLTAMVLL